MQLSQPEPLDIDCGQIRFSSRAFHNIYIRDILPPRFFLGSCFRTGTHPGFHIIRVNPFSENVLSLSSRPDESTVVVEQVPRGFAPTCLEFRVPGHVGCQWSTSVSHRYLMYL